MPSPIVEDFVVDLVGVNDEMVLPRDLYDLLGCSG
jgi:hypothetical protein